MAGRVQWEAQVDSNVAKLLGETKELRNELETISKKDIKLDIDTKSLNSIVDLFSKMEKHLKDLKSVFVDVGDGTEFSPLLKTINNIQSSIDKLSSSVKGISLNMNLDFGSDSELENKLQAKISNALQAYQRLFDHIKMSSAGGAIINTKFFDFDINQYDTMMAKLQAYKKFIENMRKEAKTQFNGKDVLYQDTDKSYWTAASAAMGQATKAFNEIKASSDTNPLENLFGGKTDLTEVVSQLNLIVNKLGEISTTASEFKNTFANGFNVSASVEEIEKLTSRVKELENELSKVMVSSTSPVETNISSPIKDTFQGDKIQEATTSARELDRTLEGVEIPKEAFDDALSQLDLTKSKLKEIVRITKDWNNGAESFTLKDKYGSTEIYGRNSNTEKGQLLHSHYVQYDAKQSERLQKDFNKAYEEAVKINNALTETKGRLDGLSKHPELSSQFSEVETTIKSLNTQLTQGEKSVSEYNKAVKEATSNYSKLVSIQQKRDTETYNANAKQTRDEAKELLAVEKEITKEIEKQEKEQASAQKKKWQAFENEQKKYVSDQKKTADIEKNKSAYQELLDTIKQYSEASKRIAKNETLDGDLELAQKLENKISELQKNPILSSSQIAKSERDLVNLFNQLETLEKKTAQKQNNQASNQVAKEHAEAWEKNLKAIQEYMDANTKLNNLMAKDKGTGKHASDIARQEKEVEKLKEAAIEARATLSSMVNPHEAPVGDWNKWIEVMEKFKQATKGSAESVAKLEDALRSARNAQLSSIDTTINNGQSKLDEFSARKDQSDVYQNKLKELGDTLERLRTLKSSLSNTRAFTNEEEHQVDALTQSVHTFIKEISQMSADEKGSNAISRFKLLDRIAEYMKKNTRMSREFKAELESLMDTLRTGGANVQTGDILTQFEKIKDRIRQAKQEGISFFDIFKNKAVYGFATRLAQYYLSFYDFIRYARYAVQSVIEFDTALTEMRKVSDESVSTLERLQKATFDLADGVGTTSVAIQESIADFMRVGDSLKEAQKHAVDANTLLRVSEFDNIENATSALISMNQAWKDIDTAHINDVLNILGNNMPIGTDELASSLQRSAGTLATLGATLEEAAALTVAGNAILQDPESVAAGKLLPEHMVTCGCLYKH